MRPHLRFIALLASLAALVTSCSDPLSFGIPITLVSVGFESARVELRMKDSTVRIDRVRGRFHDTLFLSEPIPIAGASFNGIPMPLLDSADGTYGFDTTRIASIASGVPQVFRVIEGFGFPALADSVRFPVEIDVTAPAVGTTFSRPQGITVHWTPASDGDSRIEVAISTTPILEMRTSAGSTEDDGAHVIEPRFIADVPAGRIYVFVSRVRHEMDSTVDGRNYWIDAESIVGIECSLTP